MRVILIDTNERLVKNWSRYLGNVSSGKHLVSIHVGTLTTLPETKIRKPAAVVSPGNSFGYLGGGFDLALKGYFGGSQFEQFFRKQLGNSYKSVGSASVVELQDWSRDGFKYVVYVPTMVSPARPLFDAKRPRETGYEQVFNGMWNSLMYAPAEVETLVVPGLCSGYAGVPIDISSKAMCFAIRLYLVGDKISSNLRHILIMQFLGYTYDAFFGKGWQDECRAVRIDVEKLKVFDVLNDSIDDIIPSP